MHFYRRLKLGLFNTMNNMFESNHLATSALEQDLKFGSRPPEAFCQHVSFQVRPLKSQDINQSEHFIYTIPSYSQNMVVINITHLPFCAQRRCWNPSKQAAVLRVGCQNPDLQGLEGSKGKDQDLSLILDLSKKWHGKPLQGGFP